LNIELILSVIFEFVDRAAVRAWKTPQDRDTGSIQSNQSFNDAYRLKFA
jgi:hypothetical protein